MFSSIIKGAIVGGIIAFVWSFISWMYIPWHAPTLQTFRNEELVAEAIKENSPSHGIYTIPSMATKLDEEQNYRRQVELAEAGPVVFANVVPDGVDPMGIGHFIAGIVTTIVAGAFIGIILHMCACPSYLAKVCVALSTAIFAAIVCFVPLWNWWSFPSGYIIVSMLDVIIAWFIAGLVLAAIIKPCCGEKKRAGFDDQSHPGS